MSQAICGYTDVKLSQEMHLPELEFGDVGRRDSPGCAPINTWFVGHLTRAKTALSKNEDLQNQSKSENSTSALQWTNTRISSSTNRSGVTTCVALWPGELYRMDCSKTKMETCMEGPWVEVWRTGLSGWVWIWAGNSVEETHWRNNWSKEMGFHSATFCCLADKFLLGPKPLVENPSRFPA